ncbi:MAG: hypothetical protein WBA06_14625, partial [Candidatus Aquilonibacter sp.]
MRPLLCCALSMFLCARALGSSSNLITIDVHDADISDVITLLAAQSGENIMTDATVKPQRVTIHLRNVTFDRVLGVLVTANGLQVHR